MDPEKAVRVSFSPSKAPAHDATEPCLFAEVFRSVRTGLVVWRLEDTEDLRSFRLVAANPMARRVLSLTPEDVVGASMAPSVVAWLAIEIPRQCAEVIRSGRERDIGDICCPEAVRPDGVFAARAFPLPDRCVGVAFEDVTDCRRAQERHRESQRMETLGRLAAGIAHDFKNMVTIVAGYGQLLLAREPPVDLRADIEAILNATAKAAALTHRLMAFSRQQRLEPRVLDLRRVVAGVERMLRRLIGDEIAVVTDFAADLGRVKADPAQIEQVVMNLALNAREAMPNGGTITFHLADAEAGHADPMPCVVLSVSDTGEGMDSATLARIFEPFFTTRPGRGLGLGLATVHSIVGQGGGRITVASEPGLGTTFRIAFPSVEDVLDPEEDESGSSWWSTLGPSEARPGSASRNIEAPSARRSPLVGVKKTDGHRHVHDHEP